MSGEDSRNQDAHEQYSVIIREVDTKLSIFWFSITAKQKFFLGIT